MPLYKGKNVISTKRSFSIGNDLFESIKAGVYINSENREIKYSPYAKNVTSPKSKLGVYLVNVRILNKEKKILQYRYIYYPYIFMESIMSYLTVRNKGVGHSDLIMSSLTARNKGVSNSDLQDFEWASGWTEPGPYLPIIDSRFFLVSSDKECYTFLKKLGSNVDQSDYFRDDYAELENQYAMFNKYRNVFLFINKLFMFGNCNLMSELVDLGFKKNLREFAEKVLSHTITEPKEFIENKINDIAKNLVKDNSDFYEDKRNLQNINVINSCLFVVEDINLLIKSIKDKGYKDINEGTQPNRGNVDELDSFLCQIERDYLESLYNNHMYHMYDFLGRSLLDKNYIKKEFLLPRSKFSVRNIRHISNTES